jgi:hypothetical protein
VDSASPPLPNLLHRLPAAPDTASPTSVSTLASGSVDEDHDSLYERPADLMSSIIDDAGWSSARRR